MRAEQPQSRSGTSSSAAGIGLINEEKGTQNAQGRKVIPGSFLVLKSPEMMSFGHRTYKPFKRQYTL